MNQSTSRISEADHNQAKKPDAATRWRRLVEDQRVSGLPVMAFCRQRGIPASSLFAWRKRLQGGTEIFKPVKIVRDPKPSRHGEGNGGAEGALGQRRRRADDVHAEASTAIELPAASFIELCLRRERRLIVHRGFDRQLLLDVIWALESLA